MAEKCRVVLMLEADSAALLEELITPRKKGEYVSELILRDADERIAAPLYQDTLRQIEMRLASIEALLVAQRDKVQEAGEQT